MKYMLALFAISSLLLVSCGKGNDSPAVDCSGSAKTFSADVLPVVQSSCATNSDCHGTGSINGPGPLLTYSNVFNARAAIHSAVGNGSMPKSGSLSAAQKSAILCWIDNGAANN